MIFKSYLCSKIPTGEKTQTRRPQKAGEIILGKGMLAHACDPIHFVCTPAGKIRYAVGKTYPAQPGRGKFALCRFLLLGIRSEMAYDISREDAIAEGFGDWLNPVLGFLDTWTSFYDKPAQFHLLYLLSTTEDRDQIEPNYRDYLKQRPSNLYTEWALNFEVVK